MDEKIRIAQGILSNATGNIKSDTPYHQSSFIYKKTNENIAAYFEYLKNRDRVLTVIGSSNQVLNSILAGSKNIDCFDISMFPEEYMYLHLAGVENLTQDEYMEFFYGDVTTDEKYDDIYSKISSALPKDSKEFWDSLFNFYDWYEINDSPLFSNEIVTIPDTIEKNPYLQGNNFDILKGKIRNVNIKTFTGDILRLSKTLSTDYDLVNLSSIVYYNKMADYIRCVQEFNLSTDGVILTYFYAMNEQVKKSFAELNPAFVSFPNSQSGVMVYQKQK